MRGCTQIPERMSQGSPGGPGVSGMLELQCGTESLSLWTLESRHSEGVGSIPETGRKTHS